MRTRHTFAAPFVLVVGCSGAAPAPLPPPPLRPDPVPIDAAVDAAALAPDAALPDPEHVPRLVVDPCKLPADPSNPACNPRRPVSFEARILEYVREGAGLIIKVGVTGDARVDPGWRASLLDRDGQIVETARLAIVRVDRRQVTIRIANLAVLPTGARVRLVPSW